MKKVIATALTFCIAMVLLVPAQAHAAPIQLRWDDTIMVLPSFGFSSNQYKATVTGESGTTSVKATIIVYEVNGNTKTQVASITDTKSGAVGVIMGSYSFVKGRTYYMEVTATVYRNGGSEVTYHDKQQTY